MGRPERASSRLGGVLGPRPTRLTRSYARGLAETIVQELGRDELRDAGLHEGSPSARDAGFRPEAIIRLQPRGGQES